MATLKHTLGRNGLVFAQRSMYRVDAAVVGLLQLVREELRPRPARLWATARMACIGAVGTALTAALHVSNPLGALTLWVALYASNARFTPRDGLALIAVLGVGLVASVFVAGMLLDTPWLMLPVFAIATALMTYELLTRGLAGPWFVVRLAILDTFYLAVFTPLGFGWPVAHTFAGMALVVALLVLFDMALWPDPAERRLLRSLAGELDRERERLTAIVRTYTEPSAGLALPESAGVSIMPAQLPLLDRARRELENPERAAILLAAVTTTERVHIEVERLLVIARENVSKDVPVLLRDDIDAVGRAIAAALDEHARRVAAGLRPSDASYAPLSENIRSSLDALHDHEALRLARLGATDADAAANVAAFDRVLRNIGNHLESPLGRVEGHAFPVHARAATSADPMVWGYSVRLGLAATIGFILGIASQRPDLSTIVWTSLLVALPTYGATLRRMLLYFVGAILGGVLTLAIIIIVSPNADSIGAYLLATFVVLGVCSYVGLSSGRLAYAGHQAGVTFSFAYYTLSPSSDVTAPLWRMWGITVGLLALSAVFLVKPAFAVMAIAQRLRQLLRGTMELLRPGPPLPQSRLHEINMEATRQLTQLLSIGQDARLEGHRSHLDADRVTEAASTLRRIMQRLSAISLGRRTAQYLAIPADIEATRATVESALRAHLRPWLDALELFCESKEPRRIDRRQLLLDAARSVRAVDLAAPLSQLREAVSASLVDDAAPLPGELRNLMLAMLTAYRQLAELVTDLDQQLVRIEV